MKKFNIIITAIFIIIGLITINKVCATDISGVINTNTIFSAASSPYIITGDLYVDTNVTLTIQPGVVIKFNANVTMYNYGKIIANGTSNDTILFTSNVTPKNKGDWKGIIFYNTVNAELSEMEYVQIEYSDTAIKFAGVSCYFSYLNIINNNVGIQITGASASEINYSNFYYNEFYNVICSSTGDQDFSNNYWGFTFSSLIDDKILDYMDNQNLGAVDFQPIMSSSSWTNNVIGPKNPSIIINNNAAVTYQETVTLTLSADMSAKLK